MGHYKGLKLLDILSTLEANLAKKRYQKGSIYWYFVSYDKYTEEPLYSHFKLYWKTFSAPNASYSNKYLSQFFIKITILPNFLKNLNSKTTILSRNYSSRYIK